MAKKKKESEEYAFTFKRGVDLPDGRRFEAGEEVPDDLSADERDALEELDAFFVMAEDK